MTEGELNSGKDIEGQLFKSKITEANVRCYILGEMQRFAFRLMLTLCVYI